MHIAKRHGRRLLEHGSVASLVTKVVLCAAVISVYLPAIAIPVKERRTASPYRDFALFVQGVRSRLEDS